MLLEKEIFDRNNLFSYDYILYGYHGLSQSNDIVQQNNIALDKNGEILFASCEFGEVYWLNGLDKTQMQEIIDYLNTLPNSRKMILYRLE